MAHTEFQGVLVFSFAIFCTIYKIVREIFQRFFCVGFEVPKRKINEKKLRQIITIGEKAVPGRRD